MARILDALHPPQSRRGRPEGDAKPLPAEARNDDSSGDDESVPFIEVGAPVARGASKPGRELAAPPTILPLPRPVAPEPPRAAPDMPPLFHISFQPLPFATRPGGDRRLARELVAFHQPSHPVSEQYRRLLTEIEAQLGPEAGKALLFTSPAPGAGASTVLLNLAITCAREDGTRVAVVDANLTRPALADRLGGASAPGLVEVLARTVPLAWGLQETGQENLTLLSAGRPADSPAMDLWPLVLDQLRSRFDWVLVDAAEWGRPELPALCGTATATYLVMRQADLESADVGGLLTEVPAAGGRLRGYVLTSDQS